MKYMCELCGWIYDEEKGDPPEGLAPGTRFADLPEDFECLLCCAGRNQFTQSE